MIVVNIIVQVMIIVIIVDMVVNWIVRGMKGGMGFMTENKRFKLIDGIKKGTHSGIWDNQKQHNQGIGDELWLGEVVGMLNEGVILAEENKELKTKLSEFDFLKNENKHMRTVINENMQLKKLLRKISNCNGEIWLSNGRIIRLKKIFKGEWIND